MYTSIRMQEHNNVRDVLLQAFQALNNKVDKSSYFDLHDDSLITHGIPSNFPTNKEGMKKLLYRVMESISRCKF